MSSWVMKVQSIISCVCSLVFVFMFDSVKDFVSPLIINQFSDMPSVSMRLGLGFLFSVSMAVFTLPVLMLIERVLHQS